MAKPDAKCAAKVCNFQGINPQNKTAVGVCAKCGNIEHFACVKIKTDHKEDIIKGAQKYFCSTCFRSNPSLIVPDTVRQRDRLNSLPLMGQGYLRITHSTTAKPVHTDQSLELKKCENCDFESNSLQEISIHIETTHMPKCSKCDKTFKTTKDLAKHIDMDHRIQCNICEISFNDKRSLDEHNLNTHEHEEIHEHLVFQHKLNCPSCDQVFTEESELENHINKNHRHSCSTCTLKFKDMEDLEKHIEKDHTPNTNNTEGRSENM